MSQSELVACLCGEVAELLKERSVMSCVFGSRLLLGLLRDIGVDAVATGVLLTVSDPAASTGRIGRVALIGDVDNMSEDPNHRGPKARIDAPDGFPGHVVVLAHADDRVLLLDSTAFQAIRLWSGSSVSPPASSIVLRLAQDQQLVLAADALAVHQGWTYEYSPQPHVDWRSRHEWLGVDRFSSRRSATPTRDGYDRSGPCSPSCSCSWPQRAMPVR